ncbi:DedA family protein [Streptomyces phaeochromogenes]|uniref:DedA family protein n=1 Tax=Streptomyces phaeochromogenes TaxID=1923 RepID=UPI003400502B
MTAIAAAAADSSAPQWINSLMDTLGAPGAGIAIALENLFPPLPSEVILPLAGFAASTGQMNLFAALLWTTAGSVIGALALYGVGALLGRDRTVAIAARLPLVKVSDIEKTEAWFSRHGTKAVFFGRMIPIFRSLISVPAGVERMRLSVFLGLTTLGSAIWNTIFVLAGYLLGENWSEVTGYVSTYSKVVLVGAVLALLLFAGLRLFRPGPGGRRRAKEETEEKETEEKEQVAA